MGWTIVVLTIVLGPSLVTPDIVLPRIKRQIYNTNDLLGFITNLASQGAQAGFLQRPPGAGGFPGQDRPGASIADALASIAQYDELHCVPRLLCEVAAGGKPGYSGRQSAIPFVSRDTLIKLLTALNFGDTTPLVVFGRAALLGISTQGDPGTCLSAYPTCPRDPERLVHYLNNHNGGFFRFFSGRQHYHQQRDGGQTDRSPPSGRPMKFPKGDDKARITTNGQTRPDEILADVDEDFFSHAYSQQQQLTFPNHDDTRTESYKQLFAQPATNYGKKKIKSYDRDKYHFAFPAEQDTRAQTEYQRPLSPKKPVPMVFPDRTGTGDLRLDTDGNGRIVIFSASSSDEGGQEYRKRKPHAFFGREQRQIKGLAFPTDSHENRQHRPESTREGSSNSGQSNGRLVFRDNVA